jgi:hypothetical protein
VPDCVIRGMSGVIRLSREGLAVRVLGRGRAFLRWDELRAIHREAGDLVERLVLVTDRGRLTIPVGFSARRIAKLQARILDFHERLVRARRRADLGVDEIRRVRLDRTVRVAKQPVRASLVHGAVMTLGLVATILVGWTMAVASALVLIALVARRREPWAVLELGPDGIAHGPTDSELRLLPWDEVVAAHRIYSANETTRAVRLLLTAGRWVDLKGDYDRPLDDICELVDPPLEKVALTRDQMLFGVPLEDAARNAGLPRV